MSKKSGFRGSFVKQHCKRPQALLKSALQHLYLKHWSLPKQLSWKKSLLFTCQILGLLVNTLAADEIYPVLNKDNLTIPIQMQLSEKQKTFSRFLAAFLKSRLNFKDFETKMTLIVFVFLKLWTPKTWLDKCLKSPVLEDPSTSNMEDLPKHFWNLHQSTLTIFIDNCQVSWIGKSLSYWHAKSWYCLLTRWLLMKSILLLIDTI